MGNKAKFVMGALVLLAGFIAVCMASSTAVHNFIVDLFS